MHWYLCALTQAGQSIEFGFMLATTDRELIDKARVMGYSIDLKYIGPATPRLNRVLTAQIIREWPCPCGNPRCTLRL